MQKFIVYSIRFSNVRDDLSIIMSGKNNKLFTDLNEVRSLLDEHGYEELANRGSDSRTVAKFINLKYSSSVKESYFNAPRAEILQSEIEIDN